jgi:hypothetical protein
MLRPSLRKLDTLSSSFPEIIELCASGFSASDRFDIDDVRRIEREDSFDAFVSDNSPDGKLLIYTAALFGYYGAGKNLNAGFVAFFDFTMNINGIAYLKVRKLGFETFLFY